MKILLKDRADQTPVTPNEDVALCFCDGSAVLNADELRGKVTHVFVPADFMERRSLSDRSAVLKKLFELCKVGALFEIFLPADPDDLREPAEYKELVSYAGERLQLKANNIIFPKDIALRINKGELTAGSEELKQELIRRADEISLNFIMIKVASPEHHYGYASFLNLPKFVMRLYPLDSSQWVSRALAQNHFIEFCESAACLAALYCVAERKGRAKFLNIGANLGWYPLIATLSNKSISADAFEPTPKTLEYLRENCELSGTGERIRVFGKALSDRKGSCDLFVDGNDAGSNSLARADDGQHDIAEVIKVETDTLDNIYADSKDRPDVIVMDVEGHEQKVLDGASGLLKDGWRPVIFAEFSPTLMRLRGECSYYKDFYREYGYRLFLLNNKEPFTFIEVTPEQLQLRYNELSASDKCEYCDVMLLPPGFDTADFKSFVSYLNAALKK